MTKPIMKKFKGNGIRINAAVWEGEGKTILLIHGLTANCRTWDSMVASLAPKYRVISLDLRGRGLSDKPDTGYSMEHHVADIDCVMDDIGIESAVVMGHSLGAYISSHLAANHPERVSKLVMVDGGGFVEAERAELVQAALGPIWDRSLQTFPSADAYIDYVKQYKAFHPWRAEVETYFRHEIMELEDGVRCNINRGHIEEGVINLTRIVNAPDFMKTYERVQCETLIISAAEGILVPEDIVLPISVAEEMKRKFPRAETLELKGNHFGIIFNDDEERDKAILSFIEK